MSVHQGNRLKELVEKLYSGTNIEFCEEVGIAKDTYLYQLFKKELLSPKILKKASEVLKIPATDFFTDIPSILEEPKESYGHKKVQDLEIDLLRQRVIDLEKIVKMQDQEIERYKKLIPNKSK